MRKNFSMSAGQVTLSDWLVRQLFCLSKNHALISTQNYTCSFTNTGTNKPSPSHASNTTATKLCKSRGNGKYWLITSDSLHFILILKHSQLLRVEGYNYLLYLAIVTRYYLAISVTKQNGLVRRITIYTHLACPEKLWLPANSWWLSER